MSEEPREDRIVRTALELLPVPEHREGFWDRLEVSLALEETPQTPTRATPLRAVEPPPAPARPAAPAPIDLTEEPVGVVPRAMRRPSNLILSAVAVAAAVAVVVAGSTLVRSRTDDPDEVAKEPPAAEGDEPAAATTLRAPDDEPAAEAVVAWLHHLADGDIDAAWAALGDGSRTELGSQDELESMRSALAEGYGAWAAAQPDQVLVTPLDAVEGAELAVVTLVGTVQQEGSAIARTDAFPVRVVDGRAFVELYADAGPIELVAPSRDDDGALRLLDGDEIVIVVPAGAAPVLRLDDGETVVCGRSPVTELTELDSGAQRCAYAPAGGVDPGEHLLTVAFAADGARRISADTVRFQAA